MDIESTQVICGAAAAQSAVEGTGAWEPADIARTTGDLVGAAPDGERLALAWPAAGREQRAELGEGLLSVGADDRNSIVLDDACVSRFHFRLHVRPDGRLWLRDLGSKNGTFVDGLRVLESELSCGSRLRAGSTELRIERATRPQVPTVRGFDACDPALAGALELLRRAAPSRLPVVLHGESGTGKEVAARALHELSPRAQGPLVPVNCGAIAEELAESELFGHERGAFTGAIGASPGAFGAADGGTLFLDEIGELPLALQAKLLRALESDEVKPVGSSRPRKVDVRVICATHRELRALVQEGRFREDLYWRLRGVVIKLAPLRERPQDILPLAERFLRESVNGEPCSLSPDARAALRAHNWPGNVRELKQVVRLAALLRDGSQVRRSDLVLDQPLPRGATFDPLDSRCAEGDTLDLSRARTLADVEAAAIRACHRRNQGLRRVMADELGIARSSLLRKLDALGMR